MKNKSYYLDLAERWFDALLTGDEERELKAFLAGTDDPDFDEVKAVAGFFATGKAISAGKASVDARRSPVSLRFRWVAAVAVAARSRPSRRHRPSPSAERLLYPGLR